MSRRVRVTLFAKLSILAIFLIALTASVIALFVIIRQSGEARENLRDHGRSLAGLTAQHAEYGVYTRDKESLLALLHGLEGDPEVAWVAVVASDGEVIAAESFPGRGAGVPAALRPPAPQVPGEVLLIEDTGTRGLLMAVAAVRGRGPSPLDGGLGEDDPAPAPSDAPLGVVVFGLTTAQMEQRTGAFVSHVALVAAMLLLVGIAIALLMARRMTAPLRQLLTATDALAAGDFSARARVRSKDETADLGDAFDAMAETLADYRQRIEESNRTLEAKVAERTEQLEVATTRALSVAQRADAANHAKSDFLATMSHELRTPLNAIIGFSELLYDGRVGPMTGDQRGCIDDILQSGRHLLSLVQDVLDVAKIEAGRTQLDVSPMDPLAAILAGMRMAREAAASAGVELALEEEESVPELVDGDDRKLRQVIFNLLSNAVKFTPQGGRVSVVVGLVRRGALAESVPVTFREDLAALAGDDATPLLRVGVQDTGIGVRPDAILRIFEAFQQEDNSIARRFGGTGLGLALSRQLVKLHGGIIFAESEVGVGSRFTFAVPVTQLAG